MSVRRRGVRCACKLTVVLLLVGVLSIGIGGPALTPLVGHANGAGTGVSAFCTANDNFGFTHGGCVTIFLPVNDTSAFWTSTCAAKTYPAIIHDQYGNPYVVKNQGDCISTYNALYKATY